MKNNIDYQDVHRYKELKESINHISQSIDGILRRLQYVEITTNEQKEINKSITDAIKLIAEELEILENEEEGLA